MFRNIILIVSIFQFQLGLAQVINETSSERYTAHSKGKIYFYWGGNRAAFTNSNIHFKGDNYDFTLYDVEAKDKGKGWHLDYINPTRMTIPQTNFRVGYFLTDYYSISFGLDHMKYVMKQNRTVNYSGHYPGRGNYGEAIEDGQVLLTEDFLTFEHTDGLNYINVEFGRMDDFSKYFKIRNTDIIQINIVEGIGGGVIYPKTNAKLFFNERNDAFHIAGFGLSAKAGLNVTFLKYFFVQGELKGGYIDLPNIRTTNNKADKASQHFFFVESIIAFGGIFRI